VTRLIRIKSSAVATVTRDYLAGGHVPTDWKEVSEDTGTGIEIDLRLLKDLVHHAVENCDRKEVDAWLAPRLHCALPIPRRVAADRYVWMWLALECEEYIRFRFTGKKGIRAWRINGELLRNGISRLWWGAEMCRNGSTYVDVETVFTRTRTAEFALELMYSWNRPAAIAFARVAEGKDGGERLKDEMLEALSSSLRVQLSLRALEAAHLDREEDTEEYDPEWGRHTPALADLLGPTSELRGPRRREAAKSAIDELVGWMREVADGVVFDEEAIASQ